MYVDVWYDRPSRTWYATLMDDNGLELGNSVYGYTIEDAVVAAELEGWGEYDMYKDVARNGFNQRLNK